MKIASVVVGLLICVNLYASDNVLPIPGEHLPMPPVFSIDTDAEHALRSYPLGVINKSSAFSHHGQAHRTLKLSNGLEGWVYEVHAGGKSRTFKRSDGKTTKTEDFYSHPASGSYTLVFSTDELITDVLYFDAQNGSRMSALLLQPSDSANRTWTQGDK